MLGIDDLLEAEARPSSPADSASAWRWAGRSSASRRRSCWTSRCRTWTRSSACRCARELKRLHQRLGITTIYVTHDQVEAMTLGDRDRGDVGRRAPAARRRRRTSTTGPTNLFVAGFIGSPPMNLLRGTARRGGGSRPATWSFERAGVPDGDVVAGRAAGAPACPRSTACRRIEFEVDVVEPLGDEVIVHGTVSRPGRHGRDVRRGGTSNTW